jgi:hypothetical protein
MTPSTWRFSLRESILAITTVSILMGWGVDRMTASARYKVLAAEHAHLYLTTHAVNDLIVRKECDIGIELDMTQFPLGQAMVGDNPLPTLKSWPGR